MKKLAISLALALAMVPALALAAGPFGNIIPDCNVTPAAGQQFAHECGFKDLVQMAVNLMNFLIELSTVIALVVFAWAGIRLLTSGGNPKAMSDAKHMAFSVLKGYAAIILAWLIVYTVFKALSTTDYSILSR